MGRYTRLLTDLDHETVWAFYDAALAVGGVSNGAPGLRPENNETYFAAYVLDPMGNNIEVVSLRPSIPLSCGEEG